MPARIARNAKPTSVRAMTINALRLAADLAKHLLWISGTHRAGHGEILMAFLIIAARHREQKEGLIHQGCVCSVEVARQLIYSD